MKSSKRITTRRIVLACLLILCLGAAGWAAHLTWHVFQLKQAAEQASQGMDQKSPAEMMALLHTATADLVAIRADVQPLFPLLSLLKSFPVVGTYAGQIEPWLVFSSDLARCGEKILGPFEPLLTETNQGAPSGSFPEALARSAAAGQENFIQAKALFQSASAAREKIQPGLLPEKYEKLYALLDENYHYLSAGIDLLPTLPQLAGAQEPATYLIVAQNRDELRATGGFISGIGTIQVANGKIGDFSLGDSYRVDDFSKGYPSPPEPIRRFMLAGYWVPRDANWSPDFPTAAQKIEELYALSTGAKTNGVIAFDQKAVQQLVEALGPIQLQGITEPVTAANVEAYMHMAWEPGSREGTQSKDWWEHRKDFMHLLGSALLDKITATRDPKTLSSLLKTVLSSIQQGHLLIYVNDPEAQAAIGKTGLNGGVNPGSGDFLMLVDSNIGFNKVDAIIDRQVTYQVDLRDLGQPKADLTIRYQHKSKAAVECKHVADYGEGTYADLQARCYWDYWRIYTPAETRLLQGTVQTVPAAWLLNKEDWNGTLDVTAGESGTQVFGGLMVLPPNSKQETYLQMALPAGVIQPLQQGMARYSLRIQKQAGLENIPVRIEILVPPQYPYWVNPVKGISLENGKITWAGNVTSVQTFDLIFSADPEVQLTDTVP